MSSINAILDSLNQAGRQFESQGAGKFGRTVQDVTNVAGTVVDVGRGIAQSPSTGQKVSKGLGIAAVGAAAIPVVGPIAAGVLGIGSAIAGLFKGKKQEPKPDPTLTQNFQVPRNDGTIDVVSRKVNRRTGEIISEEIVRTINALAPFQGISSGPRIDRSRKINLNFNDLQKKGIATGQVTTGGNVAGSVANAVAQRTSQDPGVPGKAVNDIVSDQDSLGLGNQLQNFVDDLLQATGVVGPPEPGPGDPGFVPPPDDFRTDKIPAIVWLLLVGVLAFLFWPSQKTRRKKENQEAGRAVDRERLVLRGQNERLPAA